MLPDMRVNKFFTISGKAEHLQAARWADCCMHMLSLYAAVIAASGFCLVIY